MRGPTVICSAIFLGIASDVLAQAADSRRAELGITVGSACLVASSACGGGREGMHGGYGSWWLTPRTEVGFRISGLWQPDYEASVTHYGPTNDATVSVGYMVTKRSRRYMLAHIYRHFGSDARIRFYAGAALGSYVDRYIVSCLYRECAVELSTIGGPATGRHSHRRGNVAFGLGLSGQSRALGWRAGVNLHNFPGENVGATELFAAAGVRF